MAIPPNVPVSVTVPTVLLVQASSPEVTHMRLTLTFAKDTGVNVTNMTQVLEFNFTLTITNPKPKPKPNPNPNPNSL